MKRKVAKHHVDAAVGDAFHTFKAVLVINFVEFHGVRFPCSKGGVSKGIGSDEKSLRGGGLVSFLEKLRVGADTDELDAVAYLLVPNQKEVGSEVGFHVVLVSALELVRKVWVERERSSLLEDAESGFHPLAVGFGEGLEVLLELR